MFAQTKNLNGLLDRACELITILEENMIDLNKEYRNSDLQKDIDTFFNEIDALNEEDTGPEYDSAGFTEEDRIVEGQYRVVINDPNWLFPGEPLHDDPDQEAQDYDTFGENKI